MFWISQPLRWPEGILAFFSYHSTTIRLWSEKPLKVASTSTQRLPSHPTNVENPELVYCQLRLEETGQLWSTSGSTSHNRPSHWHLDPWLHHPPLIYLWCMECDIFNMSQLIKSNSVWCVMWPSHVTFQCAGQHTRAHLNLNTPCWTSHSLWFQEQSLSYFSTHRLSPRHLPSCSCVDPSSTNVILSRMAQNITPREKMSACAL